MKASKANELNVTTCTFNTLVVRQSSVVLNVKMTLKATRTLPFWAVGRLLKCFANPMMRMTGPTVSGQSKLWKSQLMLEG